MTDEQKYNELLKDLGELLRNKNLTISCNNYRIKQLEEKLAAAEAEIARLTKSEGGAA